MPTNNKSQEVKGLDDFAKKFLQGASKDNEDPGSEEYIHVSQGQKASEEALENYFATRKLDFIQRAGAFTEDLVAFIIDQKKKRNLSDIETVFGIALATINLRNSYGSAQYDDEKITPEQRSELLKQFDSICWGAQQYYDENKGD
jgi:hypothetical protein